jgi:putative endonuclease
VTLVSLSAAKNLVFPLPMCILVTICTQTSNTMYNIMANRSGALHIGVTNNIKQRVHQHKNKLVEGFTKKHNIDRLIYVETFSNVNSVIAREKTIKGWLRKKKIKSINGVSPHWRDVSDGWYD